MLKAAIQEPRQRNDSPVTYLLGCFVLSLFGTACYAAPSSISCHVARHPCERSYDLLLNSALRTLQPSGFQRLQ